MELPREVEFSVAGGGRSLSGCQWADAPHSIRGSGVRAERRDERPAGVGQQHDAGRTLGLRDGESEWRERREAATAGLSGGTRSMEYQAAAELAAGW